MDGWLAVTHKDAIYPIPSSCMRTRELREVRTCARVTELPEGRGGDWSLLGLTAGPPLTPHGRGQDRLPGRAGQQEERDPPRGEAGGVQSPTPLPPTTQGCVPALPLTATPAGEPPAPSGASVSSLPVG